MADIFKPRKIPKHLIIEETCLYRRKPKASLFKWFMWLVALLVVTGLALEWKVLSSI